MFVMQFVCFELVVSHDRPKNLIAQSQSGTGKTAAFVLAMLSRVDPSKRNVQVSNKYLYFPLPQYPQEALG